jgi:S-adenosylmethionine hydrolase
VHLAVIDPGVGGERAPIAWLACGHVLVGPDNGLLAPAVALLGGPRRIVALENDEYQLPAPGPTFAGRDIMAPAAAHLCAGVELSAFGPAVDPATLTPGILPLPEARDDGTIAAEVLWVDRYGNCQLNVDADMLGVERGANVEIRLGDTGRRARFVHTFADAKPSELVLLIDSYGTLALALDRQSAATALKLRAGSSVTLVPEP